MDIPGDKTMRVDLSWIRTGLTAAAGSSGKKRVDSIRSLLARLRAQQKAATAAPAMTQSSADRSNAVLKKILSRREYQPSKKEQFIQRIMAFIFRQLENLHIAPEVGAVIGWVLLAIVIILFVVLLVYLVLRFVSVVSFGRPEHKPRHQRIEVPSSTASLASVLEAAQRDASAGQYREAFRNVYLAAILALDRSKLVKYAGGVTNWEYLRALMRQDNQAAIEVFKPMTASFDDLIYGKRPITERDYNECMARYTALEETL